ncbi:hypothetical protein D9M68_848200 [compost metagenome]
MQRGLVQRAEEDRVGAAGLGQFQRYRQGIQAVAAADRTRLAAREVALGRAAIRIEQRRVGGEIQRLQRVDAAVGKLAAGDPHAVTHFRFVGDQHHVCLAAHVRLGQQSGDQFRTDAGGIAQHHGQARKGIVAHAVVLISGDACSRRMASGTVR